jgi:hypothetical protein
MFIGLTAKEPAEFYKFTRPRYSHHGDSDTQACYIKLEVKLQAARFSVLGADNAGKNDTSLRYYSVLTRNR